jgi:hypothetical protein
MRQRLLRKKRREKRNTPIPITRFIIDTDYEDVGDTWATLHEYFFYVPELKEYSGVTPSGVRIDAGHVTVPDGYLFNASGPTIDTEDMIRAVCCHDALYDLHISGIIPKRFRKVADNVYRQFALEDDADPIRVHVWYGSLRIAGWRYWNKGAG